MPLCLPLLQAHFKRPTLFNDVLDTKGRKPVLHHQGHQQREMATAHVNPAMSLCGRLVLGSMAKEKSQQPLAGQFLQGLAAAAPSNDAACRAL